MTIVAKEVEDRLLHTFHRAASDVPAYQALLEECGVRSDQIIDVESFSRFCPLLNKSNTFSRFPLHQLCATGKLPNLAEVLTSSGHGGRFSFGLSDRMQAEGSADFIDHAFQAAFHINSRSTLAINCLPMGVGFSSRRMTVATTSVREDMAVALVAAFGAYYEQIVLVGDPLFMKKLTDHACAKAVDWSRYRVNVMIGEEIFGEHFREYLAKCLQLKPEHPENGYIMSSFGVGELGLHLCYETPATIALRRASAGNHEFAQDLLGGVEDRFSLPMIFTFDPLRTFIEVVNPDRAGYGQMTISMLDSERPMPLLRYQTGDIGCLLDLDTVRKTVHRHGVSLPANMPPVLFALRGREKETLPNRSHVGFYKDALYADHLIARHLTGAFRLIFAEGCTMHVQLTSEEAPMSLEHDLLHAMPSALRPTSVVLWPYDRFPFGMGLDYERKFSYYVSGKEAEPPVVV